MNATFCSELFMKFLRQKIKKKKEEKMCIQALVGIIQLVKLLVWQIKVDMYTLNNFFLLVSCMDMLL